MWPTSSSVQKVLLKMCYKISIWQYLVWYSALSIYLGIVPTKVVVQYIAMSCTTVTIHTCLHSTAIYISRQLSLEWHHTLKKLYIKELTDTLTHLSLDQMAAISQTIFSDAFSWMKSFVFRFKFHWSLFLRVQLRYSSMGSDYKPLFEPVMVRLPTHICVTRPQWVEKL